MEKGLLPYTLCLKCEDMDRKYKSDAVNYRYIYDCYKFRTKGKGKI